MQIDGILFTDAQAVASAPCPQCGADCYPPGYTCIRCEERVHTPLSSLSRSYEEAAQPLRARLHELRTQLSQTRDPEEIFHLKRRMEELKPMLTQMNELAELTAHYYDRGYWRSEKYTQ